RFQRRLQLVANLVARIIEQVTHEAESAEQAEARRHGVTHRLARSDVERFPAGAFDQLATFQPQTVVQAGQGQRLAPRVGDHEVNVELLVQPFRGAQPNVRQRHLGLYK